MSTSVPPSPTAGRVLFDPAGQEQAQATFVAADPSFGATALLDELRASEYGRLDVAGDICPDNPNAR